MTRHFIKTIAIIAACVAAAACSNGNKGIAVSSLLDLQQELINVTTDSTVTQSKASAVFLQYADSLYKRAATAGEDLSIRVDAQKRAGIAMTLAAMKLSDPILLEQATNEFNRAISTWVIDPSPENPMMFKEIYCVTDDGMDDCVMIDIIFNEEDKTQPEGGVIWFPHNVNNDLEVVFANMKADGTEPDFDNAYFADVVGIAPAGTMYEGSPLAAKIGEEFFPCLKAYDLLFVGYTSESEGSESFVLRLDTLHDQLRHYSAFFGE